MADNPSKSHEATFAWCFSHGGMHRFLKSEEPWCTAYWAPVSGWTTTEALADKERLYGAARFIHELPDEQQLGLIESRSARTAA